MKRITFVSALSALPLTGLEALASGPLTIVCIASTTADSDVITQAEDQCSGALLDQGVHVADPSAIAETYHEEGRAAILPLWNGAAVLAWQSVSWIERVYHARRLFAGLLSLRDTSLPYGDFEVHEITARLSYKCYDVVTHEVIAAGSVSGRAKGEDAADTRDQAVSSAIKELASSASGRLGR